MRYTVWRIPAAAGWSGCAGTASRSARIAAGVENIRPAPSKPHTYWHKDCRKHFTVTTKTRLHATKRPLRDWIYVIYSVMTGRKGVSAMQLSKELGVQYRTAWHMLHRIREACGRGDFVLKDVVEVDETLHRGQAAEHVEFEAQGARGYWPAGPSERSQSRGCASAAVGSGPP